MYAKGTGVPENEAPGLFGRILMSEAVKWYRKAAEQGLAAAQYNLAFIYANDKAQSIRGNMPDTGVPVNYAEAVKWYRKAAEQGYAMAQVNLGLMYAEGLGVPEDYVRAFMWSAVARMQVYKDLGSGKPLINPAQIAKTASDNFDIVQKRMSPAQITKAKALTAEWWAEHKD